MCKQIMCKKEEVPWEIIQPHLFIYARIGSLERAQGPPVTILLGFTQEATIFLGAKLNYTWREINEYSYSFLYVFIYMFLFFM